MANKKRTPLPSNEEIELFVAAEVDLGLAPCQIRQDLEEKLASVLPATHFSKAVIHELAETLYSASIKSLEAKKAALSTQLELAAQAPKLSPSEHHALLKSYVEPLCQLLIQQRASSDDPSLRLLAAFLATALTGYHSSGWVRYDRRAVFALASLNGLSAQEQTEVTTKVHKFYQLGMRVIGSNQPIACFKFA